MQSLIAYFCQCRDRLSCYISRERFEHELIWLAFKTIVRGPTLSEKDRHLCMRDESIRRDTCQNILRTTPNSVTSEHCRVLVPSILLSTHGTPGTMTPLLRANGCIF